MGEKRTLSPKAVCKSAASFPPKLRQKVGTLLNTFLNQKHDVGRTYLNQCAHRFALVPGSWVFHVQRQRAVAVDVVEALPAGIMCIDDHKSAAKVTDSE